MRLTVTGVNAKPTNKPLLLISFFTWPKIKKSLTAVFKYLDITMHTSITKYWEYIPNCLI